MKREKNIITGPDTGIPYVSINRTIPMTNIDERDLMKIPGQGAWEEDYTRRGLLWSGGIPDLPELPPGSRILEIGCGNGKTVMAMVQRGWDVTAIDFSTRAVALCRQVIADNRRGHTIVADARWSPFRNATFDAVFAIHMIAHVRAPDRRWIAGEVIRLIRPGGMLFFCEFSTDDFRFGKGDETEEATFLRGTNIITHYFSEREVVALFSRLTPVSVRKCQWPMRVRGIDLVRSEITAVFTK
jgi:ubiquinone/menaquinone biosynthesis C-methylase UbiE